MRYIYLTNTIENHNKFYEMTGNPVSQTFTAKWGKIGKAPQGEQDYNMTEWYNIIDKKKKKGYLDMTHTVQPPIEINQDHLAKVQMVLDVMQLNRKTTLGQTHFKNIIKILQQLQDKNSPLKGSLNKGNMIYLNEVWQKLINIEKKQ